MSSAHGRERDRARYMLTDTQLREEAKLWRTAHEEMWEALKRALEEEGVGDIDLLSDEWDDTIHDLYDSQRRAELYEGELARRGLSVADPTMRRRTRAKLLGKLI